MSARPEDASGGSWRETHRRLSAVDLRFREIAYQSPAYLDRRSFALLDRPSDLLQHKPQSWPTFLGAEKLAELQRATLAVNRLVRAVPERVFRNDPARLAELYGLDPRVAEVIFLPPSGIDTLMSRADIIETVDGFKCLEFNFSANIGGWETTVIRGLQLATSPIARFLDDEGIEPAFTDTVVETFRHMIEDLRRKAILRGRNFTLAFVIDEAARPEAERRLGFMNRELRRTLGLMGLDLEGRVVHCTYDELTVSGGSVFLGDRRIDILLELSESQAPPRIYLLYRSGGVALHNTPVSPILGDKRTLALLSQHAGSGAYSAAERALIEAYVPWTRLAVPGPVEYQGETHDLAELLAADPERFVLKEGISWAGQGVVLGRYAPPEQWRATVEQALATNRWIVQEFQESLPYLYQHGDYGCAVSDMVWGPFVFGDRYGGTVLRMQPKGMGGPVSGALSATLGTVLEV